MKYTNQTPEELDSGRCTSDGIFAALTSPIMKFSFIYTLLIVITTFWYSHKAIKLLIHRNIFSNCTQILLIFNLLNGNIWQAVYLLIKARNMYKTIRYAENRCMIEFHSSECFYDQTVSRYCQILNNCFVFSLTCDRIIASLFSRFYYNHQKSLASWMIGTSILTTFCIHMWAHYGIPLAGYVPNCLHPPRLALDNFYSVNDAVIFFSLCNCILTIVILTINLRRDRRIGYISFNTVDRYSSFENLETTKSLCSISSTQFVCLSMGAFIIGMLRHMEQGVSEELYHKIVPFVLGPLYSNLSIPILICYQTRKCIRQRKSRIGSMTSVSYTIDSHISSLQKMWS